MLRSIRPFARALLAVVAAAAAAAADDPAAGTSAAEPWLAGPFAAEAGAIARAVAEVPRDAGDVVMLFRDDAFSFAAAGRLRYRRRWVYRISASAGLEDWSLSEAAWSPWYQAKPTLRARVIGPAGDERWLDPGALRELTAAEAGLSGDRRLLRAPLPVEVGAVVEEEAVFEDLEPFFSAGVSVKHLLVMPVAVHRGRLTLEAPTTLPLRYGVRRMEGLAPRREVSAGRVRLTFDYGALPAARPVEVGLPPEEPRYPHVAFATAESWSRVASTFADVLDSGVAESDPQAVLRWLPSLGVETQLDRIAELTAGVRGNVRHEPAELGSAGLLPAAPLATLKRGAGDSQDLAALLAAALRAEGIPAYVALVRRGYGMDVEPDLPGLGRFNHALVYVPATEPVWIDPADELSRAGELASDCQGRWAMVASPNSRRLVRTPVARSGDNSTLTTIEVFMAEEGPARVVETSVHAGAAERRQRLVSAQVDARDRRRGYEAYLKAAYRAEALGIVEETGIEDLSGPFRLRLEGLRAGRAWTRGDEGAVAIDLSYLITTLPRELLLAGESPRRGAFVFHEPFVAEWRYRVVPSPGMRLRALPVDSTRRLGTGRLARSFREEGAIVHAAFRLDSGPRRLTRGQFETFRAAVQELLLEKSLVLWFDRRR